MVESGEVELRGAQSSKLGVEYGVRSRAELEDV
jgi:hypothetical protein